MTATIARTMDEHVVIVGAGPAGLAAAWALRRARQLARAITG
jgi:flavin-dependent dehydrogenase